MNSDGTLHTHLQTNKNVYLNTIKKSTQNGFLSIQNKTIKFVTENLHEHEFGKEL
jgi:hypothetical protein